MAAGGRVNSFKNACAASFKVSLCLGFLKGDLDKISQRRYGRMEV